MIFAEYNGQTKTAYFAEKDKCWSVICSLKFFVKVVLLFQEHYGRMWYEPIHPDSVFVGFGRHDE